ncbi:MAG: hypothetical protein IAF94_14870 [Pirellulaceae bacterium]|nr:hypothetical protein [Pirellulaceae bacterium]
MAKNTSVRCSIGMGTMPFKEAGNELAARYKSPIPTDVGVNQSSAILGRNESNGFSIKQVTEESCVNIAV